MHRTATGHHEGHRVCLLTEGFYPPAIGGQQKYAHLLATRLTQSGYSVHVITRQTSPLSAAEAEADGVQVTRLKPGGLLTGLGWRAVLPLALFLWRVLLLLWRVRATYDIIFVLGLKTLPFPAVLVSKLAGKACVIKPESPIELWQDISAKSLQAMNVPGGSWLARLVRGVRFAFVRRADRLVAISSQIHDELVKAGVSADIIQCIPNGVDTDLFHPVSPEVKRALRNKLNLPQDRILFVFTGRLTTSKGAMELAAAWREVVHCYTGLHLALVGSGQGSFDDCEPQLKKFVSQHGLEKAVSFVGAVEDVREYLQAADAFVFPSRYEGFGLSVAEAMACGLPVIVTPVGLAYDIVQHHRNGVLVSPDQPAELAAAIAWLVEHPESWARLGAEGRADVLARYGIGTVVTQYTCMFTALSAARRHIHSRPIKLRG